MPHIEIVNAYLPGSIGRVVELHATYYHREVGFGLYFESKVALELSEFLRRYEAARDGLWLAVADGRVEGSIVIDGIDAADEGAHLRWFIVADALRGRGVGHALLTEALRFCRDRAYPKVYLHTFEGLAAARRLYERHGFRLTDQRRGRHWGTEVNEQRFELRTA